MRHTTVSNTHLRLPGARAGYKRVTAGLRLVNPDHYHGEWFTDCAGCSMAVVPNEGGRVLLARDRRTYYHWTCAPKEDRP